MKTKFNIKISIDEKVYELEYKDLAKAQADELLSGFEKNVALSNQIQNLSLKLGILNERKIALTDLCGVASQKEKEGYIQRQLAILDEIEKTQEKIIELNQKAQNATAEIEEANRLRFSLSMSGKDIKAFSDDITKSGISFSRIMSEIDEEVVKEREKKQ